MIKLSTEHRENLGVIRLIMSHEHEGSIKAGSSPFLDQHILICPIITCIAPLECWIYYLHAHGFDAPTIAEILFDDFKVESGKKCEIINRDIKEFYYYAGIETQEEFAALYKKKIMPLLLARKADVLEKIEIWDKKPIHSPLNSLNFPYSLTPHGKSFILDENV